MESRTELRSKGAPDVRPRTLEVTLRDGKTLSAWRAGQGEPLLLLHGFTGSVEAWGSAILDPLSRSFDVIAVDLPGHGRSFTDAEPARYAMAELHADLCELLDRAGTPRAVWVGYSMGGRVALAAAVRMPDRVDTLILESASPGLRTESERAERRAADGRLAGELEEHGVETFVDAWMALPLFSSQSALPESVRTAARIRRVRGSASGWAASLRGIGTGAQASQWDALDRVQCPSLILSGSRDRKFDAIAAEMHAGIPGALRSTLSGVGHQTHLEAPTEWLREVTGFLARRRRP